MEKTEVLQEQMMARSIPCNAELQELMHQIDIMVNNKKLEWQKKMQALEVRMSIRDQELANAQSKLDQKGQEVGLLRQKLDSLQKTKFEMAQNYDSQLQALKTQFVRLTKSYEKLQLHQLKQNKGHDMEKCTENQEASWQLSSLNQKLEKQAQNCQIQISCQTPKQEKSDTCSHCKTEHLSIHHGVSLEPTGKNDCFMEKLKLTVSEIAVSRNRLQEENLKLQQEVKMYQRKCQNIEARLTEVKNELQSREDLLNMVELECQQLRKEVARIEEHKNKEDNQVKIQSAYAQCLKDLEVKKAQILVLEQQQENQQEELIQIRDRLYQEEQSHCSEVERMRTEISDLIEELHQKEITIATIMERAALLERQLQMKLEIKEKMLGKQQIIDLSNKEHETCLESTNMPEHKDERLQNDRVKLPTNSKIPLLVKPFTCHGTKHSNQTSVKMQEKEERPAQNEGEWTPQPATYEKFGCYRNQFPAWYGQGDIASIKSSSNLPFQRSSRDCEPAADGRSSSPPQVYPAHCIACFPERNKPDMLVNNVYAVEENEMSSPETLFLANATEKFLQEEEKRARDFEWVLNSHIEELQRQSENTLKKYANFKHSRHR
ncbi:deuterosome assembly protein 1 [Varanus komodoensis]|uniref:deuterosome assembly protein 1 n=1 Tax=Varanus komodoensis TaxID=61221 RepID=UPI001CF7BB68|nr:deuterosome assembly protein 1 [Varanus komodoensis]